MPELVGYSALVEQYALRVLPLDTYARIDTRVKGHQKQFIGGQWVDSFEPAYAPEPGIAAQLQFALRYEGVNLQVMALLFSTQPLTAQTELCQWLARYPESRYARVACFLYEWLMQQQLPINDPVSPRARYVAVVDDRLQFCLAEGARVSRFRVVNNLPGGFEFFPMVRKTEFLRNIVAQNLQQQTQQVLVAYDQQLLIRAAAYLYLKETQSSFEVEREKPSPQRAQRFADLLRQADSREPLSQDRLVELQNAVLDPRFYEFTWRSQQNWIGKDLAYRQQIDFVPAKPDDVIPLMSGLISMASNALGKMDAVVLAASLAFGFVYIHPFMDGNGRIHRYLIHDVLAKNSFTPRGIVLPVSAVILANLDKYIETLEHFSRPLNRLTEFSPDAPEPAATGNDAVYFRYADFTRQTEFLYQALERTVHHDLQQEINYLMGFDKAYRTLNSLIDWPPHSLDLFIQVVHSNGGKLSINKRKSHFYWMQDNEIARAEECVTKAFGEIK